ncbi:hypothetical protein EPUS_04839 [Endocarpon pusillum Z07020]|uniref:Uncharacterized protein n=1 Tax=Endocarpon pusillum (strain Z07020 / HMAS-L-300199) TaxID=1263415 RepID=U1GBW9_ENDPU|nr:uncharacterized protein EPUS_04839 [Endocarpon pusillum Z07020]ERF75057.1 hypothetical protein EPUS_04839 [Endocarpon pusillum Z07020]
MEAAQSMATLPQLRQFEHIAACPSTKASTLETSTRPRAGQSSKTTSTVISPLNSKFSPTNGTDFGASPERPTKRIRLVPSNSLDQLHDSGGLHRAPSYGPKEIDELPICPFQPLTPHMISSRMSNPMTPASSPTNSDVARQTWRLGAKFYTPQDHHVRRVSVHSLLLSSPEVQHSRTMGGNPAQAYADCTTPSPPPGENSPTQQRAKPNLQPESYGLDRGSPDIDVPNNNDSASINGVPPSQDGDLDAWLENAELGTPQLGFRLQKREFVFAKGGYYASPVPIKIPRTLQPLPSALLESPMNLLYFHHFLNHTAKVLVVHDCSQNPFRTILPQMAMQNDHLCNLLLAYSASHRARLLNHPEPANRIARWVRHVFPSLRHALDDAENSDAELSNANLATAIMLTSLEIISPSAFGVHISWRAHLNIARRIIRCDSIRFQSISRKNAIPYFLHLWLAYIDVFGSLSSGATEEPLYYATLEEFSCETVSTLSEDDDYTIECMLGFTSRCVPILARIANLARLCSNERQDTMVGTINHEWRPAQAIQLECGRLQAELERSRRHSVKLCPHYYHVDSRPSTEDVFDKPDDDAIAMIESEATNDAFHRAALIHLLRRVRNLPRYTAEIQNAVQDTVDAISKVRAGGSAEACLLFPMFTAGVEAEGGNTRSLILERIKSLEGVGMMHVARARTLMEKVWETGQDWETLAQGEFFG